MSSSGIDLEVLPDGSESAAVSRSPPGRARRWVIVGGGLSVVAAVWLAFPGRSSLARSELRRLEGQWLHAQALDSGRFTVMGKLTATAAVGDEGRVRAGDAAVYQEEAARLRAIRNTFRADLLIDRGLSRLRAEMTRALAAQTADLERLAAWYSVTPAPIDLPPPERTPSTAAAIDRAHTLLDAQLHRFGLAPRPPPRPPPFRSADPTLVFMSRILNARTGTRLIVETADALLRVDIDANRVTPAHLVGVPAPFQGFLALRRRTYVVLSAVANGRSYVAAPLDLQGQVRPLGGDSIGVVAAANPDDVWLENSDGTVVEEDGQGRILIGPVPLPNGTPFVIGAVDAGLVLYAPIRGNPNGVIVWNPDTRTTVRIVTADASNVTAVGADTVVWWQNAGSTSSHRIVHLTTISTGQDRTVSAGPNLEPIGDRWSLSPDGTKVASTWLNNSSPADTAYAPGLIDIASGRLDLAPGTLPGPPPSSIDWSASGDRILITGSSNVLTYQLGSNTIEQLRLHHTAVLAIAVLPPDNTPRSP